MKKQTFTTLLGSSVAFFFLVCSWSCQKENELPEVSLFQVEVPSGALQPGEIAYVLLSGQDGEEITLETLSEGMSLDLTGRYDVAAPVCITLFRKKPTIRGHFKAWELTTYCDLREGKLVVTPSGASLNPEVRYQFDHVNAFASADPQRETLHHP